MSDWASVLTSALDEVEYGIVLLDKDMRARFINRAYYLMLSLPAPQPGQIYSYADILAHARKIALWDIPISATDAYVANRMDLVRTGAQPPEHLRFQRWAHLQVRLQGPSRRRPDADLCRHIGPCADGRAVADSRDRR